jgi:hypothetical protein
MKDGDEDMIDDQALMLASVQGHIKEMKRTQTRLNIFANKISMARQKQDIGASMIAVSRALGAATKDIQLDKVMIEVNFTSARTNC